MPRSARPAFTLVVALAVSASLAPAAAQDRRVPPALAARVDSIFAEWDDPDSPGAALAVLEDGEIVLERGWGSAQLEHGVPITPATVFHVASVTKQFTAFAVALLAHRGALSLDDDVRTHLPELPEFGAPVTLRQLIHHTSGVRDQWELLAMAGWRLDDVITKDHVLALMRRQRELNFEPGAEYLYSNMGYTLLAEVVERVGGRPFPEWMAENVFHPVGMHRTHMHDDHAHLVPGRAYSYRPKEDVGWENAVLSYANAGATSLFTTAGDLARWLLNLETGQVGGPQVRETMHQRAVLSDGDTIDYAFGLGRGEHRGRTTWAHGGADAGFRSVVLHIPEERLGVVVLSNAASFQPGIMAEAVADLFLVGDDADPAEPPQPVARPSARLLEAYEGRYEVEELGIFRLRRERQRLVVVVNGDVVPLTPLSDSTFRADALGAVLRLSPDEGRVTGIAVEQEGRTLAGRRLTGAEILTGRSADYPGAYYSPELETIYRVEAREGRLVAVHLRHGEIPLEPVDEDLFRGNRWFFGRLAFIRDDDGRVDGFRLSGGRVRGVRFVRLAEGALPP